MNSLGESLPSGTGLLSGKLEIEPEHARLANKAYFIYLIPVKFTARRDKADAAVPIPERLDAANYVPILCVGITVFNTYANKFGYRVVALSRKAEEIPALQLQGLGGAAMVVAMAPDAESIRVLVNRLQSLGKLVILGGCWRCVDQYRPINCLWVFLHGWPSGHALDSEEAIRFAGSQGVNYMVEKFPLE
ncbi:uncharacterized protein ATNIH1004_010110 [Aspergillus tanneri]|uniref:Alcohol dehydrogenase-like C-terminal domain-containing protein n=1 Tax=Aspergillus tanneri TaxID=1220188 RepID=A0A5M9MED5_9EURO|nr:uncharacterized protein ATNIH1004_010110 [Aspergillus tanneri]KAA8643343.1 hypothetical protein ATNIH1004_010110 [Aspergillus tanneri]